MKKIFTGVLLFISSFAFAQVNNPWTQYYQAPYLQNAALSGIEKFTDIKLGYKRQWAGLEDGPKDYFVGVNHAMGFTEDSVSDAKPKLRTGISAYLSNSSYNITNNFQSGLGYAVHVPITKEYNLSFGLAASYNQTKLNMNKIVARDKQDEVYIDLMNSNGRVNYLSLDAGGVFYSNQLYAGYSANRLKRKRLGDNYSSDSEFSIRHTFIMGYSHKLNEVLEIQPSALLRIENGLQNLYNLNVKAQYKSMVWGGLGYSHKQAISILMGYNFKNNVTLSYSYDFNTSAFNNGPKGNHEIVLGFMPFNKSKKSPTFW